MGIIRAPWVLEPSVLDIKTGYSHYSNRTAQYWALHIQTHFYSHTTIHLKLFFGSEGHEFGQMIGERYSSTTNQIACL